MVSAAASEKEAAEITTRGLIQKLSKSLPLPEADLDPSKPAFRLGVDSLIAVEVRYWFIKQLRVEVSVLNIVKDQSLAGLCCSVMERSSSSLLWLWDIGLGCDIYSNLNSTSTGS